MRETKAALVAHVGGHPTATQKLVIDRAVQLSLRIALLDAKQSDGGMTEHDSRTYLAWVSSLNRLLRELGPATPSPAERTPTTLQDHVARRVAERDAA